MADPAERSCSNFFEALGFYCNCPLLTLIVSVKFEKYLVFGFSHL